jgi:HlyD family secretion protein
MKMRTIIFLLVAIAVVAAGGTYYLKKNGESKEPKYRTETVERGTVSATVTATGTISAVTTVQVGSQVSGIIQGLYADFNSPVKKGQLLATLDPTPFQTQVEQRQADLLQAQVQARNAEVQFHRGERLLAEQLTPAADFDAAKATFDGAKAQVAQAQAALKQAQTNLGYARIYSPIDGVVVARAYDIGQTVAASFQAPTLFTIAEDLTKMQVQADVDQSDISRVQTGQIARFTVDAYPEENFSGAISQIRLNATQNQNVITYPVIIDVANPGGRLKPKMTADVNIEVDKQDGVLRVPNAALRFKPIETGRAGSGSGAADQAARATFGGNGNARAGGAAGAGNALATARGGGRRQQQTVYVVDAAGAIRPVAVKTGITDGRFTAIVEGELKEGDKIAVGFLTQKSDTPANLPPGLGGRGPGGGGGGGGRRP